MAETATGNHGPQNPAPQTSTCRAGARKWWAKWSPTAWQKTIVVEVTRKKAHPFYGRVVARNKKFYAHDEKNEAHVGDVVRLEETRPLSKLKRWKLKDIVRKTALVPEIVLERDAK